MRNRGSRGSFRASVRTALDNATAVCFWTMLGMVIMAVSSTHAAVVTYTLENVYLADGNQITGTFDWTYSEDDFEDGSGVFSTLVIPHSTYSLAGGNVNIDVQTDSIEISGNGDFHDEGLDITLRMLQPFTPTESAAIDLSSSFFECCGNGFQDQPFISGSISTHCIAEVVNVSADSEEHFYWPAVPTATTYFAYLGASANLYDHVCIGGSGTPEWTYSEEPPPGQLLYFLFSAAGECGEGGLGPARAVAGCVP